MADIPASDSRRQIAEHNVTAILDGAERLLRRGEQPSISAVAGEAGVSRPTVYAHFPDKRELLEALVERTVRQTMSAISTAQPERGTAADALQRLITAAWRQLADHDQIAHAAASELSAQSMRAAHHSARSAISDLVERGRTDRSFRTDLPADWLVTASLALIHATAEEVRTGDLDADAGLQALQLTIGDLFRKREDATGG
jgi:AcrR family transcriptional regulator